MDYIKTENNFLLIFWFMDIYHLGTQGAWSHLVATKIVKLIDKKVDNIIWYSWFSAIWEHIEKGRWIAVLPIDNSYAGTIHENLYKFLRYEAEIIGEYNLEIEYSLMSNHKKIGEIKKVYAHQQWLSQCYDFIKKNKFETVPFSDNGGAAQKVSKYEDGGWSAALAPSYAAKIYNLNILKDNIRDQKWNTTRFFIVIPKWKKVLYKKKANKTTLLFSIKSVPAALYKCLWAFATNNINLTKIESLPSLKDPFTYIFWLDFEWNPKEKHVQNALHELLFFTDYVKILGTY